MDMQTKEYRQILKHYYNPTLVFCKHRKQTNKTKTKSNNGRRVLLLLLEECYILDFDLVVVLREAVDSHVLGYQVILRLPVIAVNEPLDHL